MAKVAAIIAAAGKGERFGGNEKKTFAKLPRYVVGLSSDGADNYFSHYEYVATSKTVMETLCRYLTYHLRDEDIRLNVLRTRNVLTDAVDEIFGPHYVKFMRERAGRTSTLDDLLTCIPVIREGLSGDGKMTEFLDWYEPVFLEEVGPDPRSP